LAAVNRFEYLRRVRRLERVNGQEQFAAGKTNTVTARTVSRLVRHAARLRPGEPRIVAIAGRQLEGLDADFIGFAAMRANEWVTIPSPGRIKQPDSLAVRNKRGIEIGDSWRVLKYLRGRPGHAAICGSAGEDQLVYRGFKRTGKPGS